ncbi:hypothetical protein BH09ACT1_BH09ACT1_08600 [soil metagenome]
MDVVYSPVAQQRGANPKRGQVVTFSTMTTPEATGVEATPFQTERDDIIAAVGTRNYDLFLSAVEVVVANQTFSMPALKLALNVGSVKARQLTRLLEAQGVISARGGDKPREVLIHAEDLPLLLFVLRA